MKRKVIFAPEAKDDLFALYAYISEHSGPQRAINYIGRIERIASPSMWQVSAARAATTCNPDSVLSALNAG